MLPFENVDLADNLNDDFTSYLRTKNEMMFMKSLLDNLDLEISLICFVFDLFLGQAIYGLCSEWKE